MIINENVKDLVASIKQGKIVCFKTDTIWGFSADSTNKNAIQNLYNIKQRSLDKPFIFLIKKGQDLSQLVKNISPQAKKLINTFWCGPLTLIFEAKDNLSILNPYKNTKTIALRMPDDVLTQQILNKLSMPLPSTSVNIEGEPALNSYEEIIQKFKEQDFCILKQKKCSSFDFITKQDNTLNKVTTEKEITLDSSTASKGQNNKNISSTIISFTNGELEILREGTITKQQILDALK